MESGTGAVSRTASSVPGTNRPSRLRFGGDFEPCLHRLRYGRITGFHDRYHFNQLAVSDDDLHFNRLIRLFRSQNFIARYEDLLINYHLFNGLATWDWDGSRRRRRRNRSYFDILSKYESDYFQIQKTQDLNRNRSYFGILLSKFKYDDFQIQKTQDLDGEGVINKRFAVRDECGTSLPMIKCNCQPRPSMVQRKRGRR